MKQRSGGKDRRILNITGKGAQPFSMVIPNPGHIEDMERYRLQNTVMGGGAKQYLYMTISSTFQLSFFYHISKRYTNCY